MPTRTMMFQYRPDRAKSQEVRKRGGKEKELVVPDQQEDTDKEVWTRWQK